MAIDLITAARIRWGVQSALAEGDTETAIQYQKEWLELIRADQAADAADTADTADTADADTTPRP